MLKLKSETFKSVGYFPKILVFFAVFAIILNIGGVILSQWTKYSSHNYWQDFQGLKREYLDSQYVNKHPKGWIPDEAVNSYAAGAYIKGTSPVLIGPDTPPLGRYLIGLSALIFQNGNIIILFFALLSLVMLYLIGKQVYTYSLTSFLPVLFFSFEPIFKNQLVYVPLLDIIQLGFLLLFFYFFNKAIFKNGRFNLKYSIAANVFLGCFIATKFYATGITIVAAAFFILILHRKWQNLKTFFLTTPFAVIVLLCSYLGVFSYKMYSLSSFIGIQKYIYLYHKSQLIYPFSIWPLILFNKWHVWWGSVPFISDPQWSVSWPAVTCLSFITIIFYLIRKIKHQENIEIFMCWVIFYFGFFSFGEITTRYFVILIPILYFIAFYGLEKFAIMVINRYARKH